MSEAIELNWEPVRSGEIYCSSACGGGCTIDSYLQAGEDANRLCKELGSGWFPRVWENLGWHYSAKSANDQVEVHETRYTTGGAHYTAYAGGKADNGDTPREAIENLRARLTRMRDEAQTNLDSIPVFPNT